MRLNSSVPNRTAEARCVGFIYVKRGGMVRLETAPRKQPSLKAPDDTDQNPALVTLPQLSSIPVKKPRNTYGSQRYPLDRCRVQHIGSLAVCWARYLGITYEELNVWLFCVAWPALTIALIVWLVFLIRQNRRLKRQIQQVSVTQ